MTHTISNCAVTFLLAASIGVWLFYVQHQFEDVVWANDGDWTLLETTATVVLARTRCGLEGAMADDKTKRGEPDRSKVAADETYELGAFAAKHGLSLADARALIKKAGNNRAVLDKEAAAFKKANKRYTM